MTIARDRQLSFIEGMERPVGRVPTSVFTRSNAELMRAMAPLYLTGSVLDVTYGLGKWWEKFRPEPFTFHDLALDGVDFRHLPYDDDTFDTVAFDPPYTLSGTASSARLGPGFQHRYGIGMKNTRASVSTALDRLIVDGLAEALRVARKFVLVKCMEYAQGSHNGAGGSDFHDVPYMVTEHALSLGWEKHDQIVHFTGTGPGGHNIFTVRRCRRAHSYLIVFVPRGAPTTRPVTDAPASLLQGGSMGQSPGGRTGDGESSA